MHVLCRILSVGLVVGSLQAVSLPGGYYRLMEAGADKVESRLNAQPGADLKALESQSGSRHFPYAILAPAVLYAKQHRDNPRHHDPKMLTLALRIGDLLASEDEKGTFEPRGDSDWDTYLPKGGIDPEDTEVLDNSGDAILTLVTCYPFYFVGPAPKRFIVRARLLETITHTQHSLH